MATQEIKQMTLAEFDLLIEGNRTLIPEKFIMTYFGAIGKPYIDVPVTVIRKIEKAKEEKAKRDSVIALVSDHRLTGMDCEKIDPLSAIQEYKKAIEIGEASDLEIFHSYSYAYQRIITLLHKQKQFEEEKRFITAFLKHNVNESDRAKYNERLSKLQ